jgi:glycosyltransferase involved in cell wall biosynthesis
LAAYRASAAVVVPSVFLDPSPLVNFESMAASRPVIATCHGGSSEVVLDGVTGYIVNPFDTAAFADRIVEVLTQRGLRDRLGRAGHERFLSEFTLESHVEWTVAEYGEAIGNRG